MNGTFYIISGRVGTPGYLSLSDLQTLASGGNEIGDHTVSHLNLTNVDPDEAARQVCDARTQLMSWGFHIWDFAYPQGGTNSQLEQIVRNCNLNSARIVSNIVSPGACDGCPYAETIPPRDPYAIATPDAVKSDWSLADIQTLVTQAQQHGGGWVPIVFHKICNGCDAESIAPSTLNTFLDWLGAQQGVTVKTVHQVVGGPELPPVSGPSPPPPSGDMIKNASLETDANANGVPDCWTVGGSGSNSFTAQTSGSAHSGSVAEQITISSFSSGDRRLTMTQDLGQCAPPASPGDRYSASAFVKGSGSMRWVAYYRTSQGIWQYWTQSADISGSSSYASTTWTTPPLPAGAVSISVGISLRSVGTFTADDFGLVDATPSDHTPPVVSISAPVAGANVSGTVPIDVVATDDVGVASVRFFLDGVSLGSKTAATVAGGSTYRWNWNTAGVASGSHTLTVVATDAAGNQTTSQPVSVTIGGGDQTAPVVSISAPVAGAGVSGTVPIDVVATDDVGVASVRFFLDGVSLGSKTAPTVAGGSTYRWNWSTTGVASGSHTLTVVATDAAGNQTTSQPVSVTIGGGDQTAPVVSISAPVAGVGLSGTVPIDAVATDDVGVASVRFFLDGVSLGSKTAATVAGGSTYRWNWNTGAVPSGSHTLTAVATDAAGNDTTSAAVGVTIG